MSKFLISEYGFIGIAILAMAGVIIYLFKDGKKERGQMLQRHLDERKEWKDESKEQFKTVVTVAKETTSVVNSVKTLIESIDRRGLK